MGRLLKHKGLRTSWSRKSDSFYPHKHTRVQLHTGFYVFLLISKEIQKKKNFRSNELTMTVYGFENMLITKIGSFFTDISPKAYILQTFLMRLYFSFSFPIFSILFKPYSYLIIDFFVYLCHHHSDQFFLALIFLILCSKCPSRLVMVYKIYFFDISFV